MPLMALRAFIPWDLSSGVLKLLNLAHTYYPTKRRFRAKLLPSTPRIRLHHLENQTPRWNVAIISRQIRQK